MKQILCPSSACQAPLALDHYTFKVREHFDSTWTTGTAVVCHVCSVIFQTDNSRVTFIGLRYPTINELRARYGA